MQEYLRVTPARVLVERLHLPLIGIARDGVVQYTSQAFDELLGMACSPVGRRLLDLLKDDFSTELFSQPSVALGGTVLRWVHREGHDVCTVVSHSLLQRRDDDVLLIALTDVTELRWSFGFDG